MAQFLGRFHLLLVHAPIVLVALVAVLEGASAAPRRAASISRAFTSALPSSVLAAASSAAAASRCAAAEPRFAFFPSHSRRAKTPGFSLTMGTSLSSFLMAAVSRWLIVTSGVLPTCERRFLAIAASVISL